MIRIFKHPHRSIDSNRLDMHNSKRPVQNFVIFHVIPSTTFSSYFDCPCYQETIFTIKTSRPHDPIDLYYQDLKTTWPNRPLLLRPQDHTPQSVRQLIHATLFRKKELAEFHTCQFVLFNLFTTYPATRSKDVKFLHSILSLDNVTM